jgi:hypothetical protein
MVPQYMTALKRANTIRLSRALLRRDVASGRREAADVVLDPPDEAATATVLELLMWQRDWGRARALRFLASLRDDGVFVSEQRRLRDLTQRERLLIVPRLSGERGVPTWPAAA